jgi:hypothetical protein
MTKGSFKRITTAREYTPGESYTKKEILVTSDRRKILYAEQNFTATSLESDIADGKLSVIIDRDELENMMVAYAVVL